MDECDSGETKTTHLWGFFIYRNRMKILKKDCLGKRQPSLKPVNLAGYRRRTAIWFKKQRIDTIRLKLLKVAAKVVHSARYTVFKLCSSCPYKKEFYETLSNIQGLRPQLE